MSGKEFPSAPAYLPTPSSIPETSVCRTFRVPGGSEWLATLMAAVGVLSQEWRWYWWGDVSPADAAEAWNNIINLAYFEAIENGSCPALIPTPFWDDGTDTDDEAEPASQIWYGRVTDLDNPTTTFVEDAAIWSFAGILALAGAPAAAIAFTTTAPQFVVNVRRGALGEIIRLYLDGEQAAEVNTSTYNAGAVIPIAVFSDNELSSHDLLIVRMS